MSSSICIVGAGVMGLSSAVCLQNSLPDVSITIVADKFSPDTTSDGSGGFWEPHLNPFWKESVLGYRPLTDKEIKTINPYAKGGTTFTSLMIDLDAGYDIIINCSGIGAAQLVEDKTVRPIRGQLIKVHAPWVKHFYISFDGTDDVYILPGVHGVSLGGTSQKENWNTNVSISDRDRIWSGCIKMVPSLENAKVIHNYGHGGSGITLHWGCALDVVRLVKDALSTVSKL
ncbi:hypothetical protein KUTeg_016654 [Tegillarca granosa]|uniref:FAD dependent oxidoreductase domain-containing protein n=1 Tax=Tegillarca granosa TaxID=220873 RepID=A0ABQ9ELG4_TEGGR|nr:hypothetical protein KUTeg_016654 [Tegillarca granosa]